MEYLKLFAVVMPMILGVGFILVVRQRDKAERELARWRTSWEEHRRWLAEFNDVAIALESLKADADGTSTAKIGVTRDEMRARRNLREARQDLEAHCRRVAETPFIVPGVSGLQYHVHQSIERGTRITETRMPL